jgi:hypothetical protein
MCCKDDNQTHQSRNRLHGAHHMGKGQGACGCSCGGRKFLSKEEELESLEEYKESLKRELEGVEEKLNELKGE